MGVATSGALGFAQSSFASTTQSEEVVSNLAGIDGRIAIFFVFAPVLGWVAYNILGPGLSQLEDMQKKNSRRGIAAGLTGLSAASLMAMPEQADAAEQVVGNLAGIDGRIAIFFVFAPVLGWVAYNILGPGLKQLDDMQVKNAKRKGIVGGAIGSALGASLTMQPESADAAEQVVGNLAGIDGRIAIFFVFAPVLGWVAYNILGPGLNQLEDMQKKNAKKRGIVAGLTGLSAASLMAMPEQADAAEQVVGNLAGIDGRIAIFFVFAPVLGWVAYNILGPGLKQLDDMQVKNAKRK